MATTPDARDVFTQQLDAITNEYNDVRKNSQHDDCSDVMSETKAVEMTTRAYAAIERIAGRDSVYWRRGEDIRKELAYEQLKVLRLVGVLRSMSLDLKAGYLKSFEELIHGEVFGDFLSMAHHLLETGYKDAAAVIAGSTLESHLRQLAKRVGVQIEISTSTGIRPKAADQLNADLVKASAYAMLDQKNVTAWLDLRNKAAHGRYSEYQKEQVSLMIAGIRDFMTRHSA